MGEVVKEIVESVAKYKNLSDKESNEDASKICEVSKYISKGTDEVKSDIEVKGLIPIIIGSGNNVIDQYPTKNMSILRNSKVFILTNSDTYEMPDITGWSSSEVITFANLIHLSYNIDGYGKVTSSSINPGEIITQESILNVTLGGVNEKVSDGIDKSQEN